jgi:hypothetical protein
LRSTGVIPWTNCKQINNLLISGFSSHPVTNAIRASHNLTVTKKNSVEVGLPNLPR